ncbi:MAG: hypothetical protein RXQ56_07345 [Thermoproteus sp.]|jgi:Fe2+ or Zn2+ uptake regulation protein|uniref:hypothetical protein n=1 Tax=Thermoproteus sp. CP80 TaxID=1650659 RepID=UPI0009BD0371|nr:hypothetical protein [Thermoproteus sp. CP80]MCI4465102.1 hypothetical protein [Thermoproteus sp.]PLC67266.1 hypothetical protein B7L68_00805 [Thermoproteus sp. CP80]
MKNITVDLVNDVIETIYKLKRQEVMTSEEIQEFLRRARPDITEAEIRKALMVLELYGRIHVRKLVKGGKEIYQVVKRH